MIQPDPKIISSCSSSFGSFNFGFGITTGFVASFKPLFQFLNALLGTE
jgi:hypothetical protein